FEHHGRPGVSIHHELRSRRAATTTLARQASGDGRAANAGRRAEVTLRLGTRGSPLARWQAEWVADRLRSAGHEVELVLISTRGDQQQHGPIGNIGTGVFTKEIQRALLDGTIDLTVHSLKDLPTDPVPGLRLAAVPERESTSDSLISRD